MRFPYYNERRIPVECPNCRVTHDCPIHGDEDGAYAEMETERCHADDCTKELCSSCPQTKCSSCDLLHCHEHITVTVDGPVCPVCLKLMEASEAEVKEQKEESARDEEEALHPEWRCPPRE